MTKHLITIGDLVLDIILPVTLPVHPEQHQHAAQRRIEPGGATNTIITARNLGLRVTVVGAVGADFYGEQILTPLRATGADCSLVEVTPDSATTLVVTLTDQHSGEHVFLGHYGEGPVAIYPAGLDEQIEQADALFLSGYTLAETRLSAVAQQALDYAYQRNVPIYLDVGPFLNHADQELVNWTLERTHLLFLTEEETAQVIDHSAGREAYAELLMHGPTYAVIKRGSAGCKVVTVDWWLDFPAFSVDQVVDTVGAGDCFAAAFIAGLISDLPLNDCATLANATGAANAQKVGAGTNSPTRAEIQAILDAAGETLVIPD